MRSSHSLDRLDPRDVPAQLPLGPRPPARPGQPGAPRPGLLGRRGTRSRDHPFPHRHRAERAGRKNGPQLGEEDLLAALDDGADGLTVHPGRARSPVGPDPRHALSRVAGSQTRLYRSSNRRLGSSVTHRCSLAWFRCTRATASRGVGHGAPAFTGDLQPIQCQSCGLAAALRHLAGFPDLGLLRRLRPSARPTADDGPVPTAGLDGRAGGQPDAGSHVHHATG